MTDDTQPDALGLADWLEAVGGGPSAKRCAALLREQHARIAELEAELEAVGAGGVSGPLMARASLSANAGKPVAWQYRSLRDNGAWFDCTKERFEMRCTQPEIWETRALYAAPPTAGFTAADMATASAQGFRDGVASLSANAGEPVAYLINWPDEPELGNYFAESPTETGRCRPLYLAAPPTAQAEGWMATAQHQTYRCKIKSRKQIDKEIPRDQQGWWAYVAAGQKLLLRPAVQADIDRCHLGPRRSKNPDDYMCETQTNGSLVSKIALEYMHPEQNVFAAVPPPPTSAEGVEHG